MNQRGVIQIILIIVLIVVAVVGLGVVSILPGGKGVTSILDSIGKYFKAPLAVFDPSSPPPTGGVWNIDLANLSTQCTEIEVAELCNKINKIDGTLKSMGLLEDFMNFCKGSYGKYYYCVVGPHTVSGNRNDDKPIVYRINNHDFMHISGSEEKEKKRLNVKYEIGETFQSFASGGNRSLEVWDKDKVNEKIIHAKPPKQADALLEYEKKNRAYVPVPFTGKKYDLGVYFLPPTRQGEFESDLFGKTYYYGVGGFVVFNEATAIALTQKFGQGTSSGVISAARGMLGPTYEQQKKKPVKVEIYFHPFTTMASSFTVTGGECSNPSTPCLCFNLKPEKQGLFGEIKSFVNSQPDDVKKYLESQKNNWGKCEIRLLGGFPNDAYTITFNPDPSRYDDVSVQLSGMTGKGDYEYVLAAYLKDSVRGVIDFSYPIEGTPLGNVVSFKKPFSGTIIPHELKGNQAYLKGLDRLQQTVEVEFDLDSATPDEVLRVELMDIITFGEGPSGGTAIAPAQSAVTAVGKLFGIGLQNTSDIHAEKRQLITELSASPAVGFTSGIPPTWYNLVVAAKKLKDEGSTESLALLDSLADKAGLTPQELDALTGGGQFEYPYIEGAVQSGPTARFHQTGNLGGVSLNWSFQMSIDPNIAGNFIVVLNP